MRSAVRDAFVRFSAPLEGVVGFLYCDVKGLVTTAIGVLVDPVSMALPLPFRRPDGTPATRDEIVADWHRVKARQDLRPRGGMAYRDVAQLRLTGEGVDAVTFRKLDQMWTHLRGRFAELDTWPADAQLALLSHAWAVGPAFTWPMLLAALRARDFSLAALECSIKGGGTIVERNRRNKTLWRNAAIVDKRGLDPDVLYWPRALDDSEPTLPALPPVPESEPTEPVGRVTLPFGAEIGDDIAQAATDEITRRNGGG